MDKKGLVNARILGSISVLMQAVRKERKVERKVKRKKMMMKKKNRKEEEEKEKMMMKIRKQKQENKTRTRRQVNGIRIRRSGGTVEEEAEKKEAYLAFQRHILFE